MDILLLVIVFGAGVGALVLLGTGTRRILIARHRQQRHARALRDRFGPEYERAVAASGRHDGEQALDARLRRYEALEHPTLSPHEREEHTEAWWNLQLRFVDAPERSVREAEHLVVTVMEERGFPTSDGVVRADALSVEDPEVASAYRSAHRVFCFAERGIAEPDRLRDALVRYRDVFEQLLDRPQREATTYDPRPPAHDSGAPLREDAQVASR